MDDNSLSTSVRDAQQISRSAVDNKLIEVFDLYYASIVSMQLHPGFNRDNCFPLSLSESADMALEMINIRKIKCPQSSQE